MRRILLIDNYDSFTWNLYHLIRQVTESHVVCRYSDQWTKREVEECGMIVLSPGPGIPEEMTGLMELIDLYYTRKPILGICLGHQALGRYFGIPIRRMHTVAHGVRESIKKTGRPSSTLALLPDQFEIGRYHSWYLEGDDIPDFIDVTAQDSEGRIMALAHRDLPLEGLQFHPESYMCPMGEMMMQGFIGNVEC